MQQLSTVAEKTAILMEEELSALQEVRFRMGMAHGLRLPVQLPKLKEMLEDHTNLQLPEGLTIKAELSDRVRITHPATTNQGL